MDVIWAKVVAAIGLPVVKSVMVPNDELGTQVPAGNGWPPTENGCPAGVQVLPGCEKLG